MYDSLGNKVDKPPFYMGDSFNRDGQTLFFCADAEIKHANILGDTSAKKIASFGEREATFTCDNAKINLDALNVTIDNDVVRTKVLDADKIIYRGVSLDKLIGGISSNRGQTLRDKMSTLKLGGTSVL